VSTYLKIFLIAGAFFGVVAHIVTRESMPWWPDTVIMGVTFGAACMLIAIKARADRRAMNSLVHALKGVTRR